jgi:hypothetical protein
MRRCAVTPPTSAGRGTSHRRQRPSPASPARECAVPSPARVAIGGPHQLSSPRGLGLLTWHHIRPTRALCAFPATPFQSLTQVAAGRHHPRPGLQGGGGGPAPGHTSIISGSGPDAAVTFTAIPSDPRFTMSNEEWRINGQLRLGLPLASFHNQPHAPCPHGCRHRHTHERVNVRYGWHLVTDCQKANQGKKAHKALSPPQNLSKVLELSKPIQTYPTYPTYPRARFRGVGSEGRPGCSPLSRRSGFPPAPA